MNATDPIVALSTFAVAIIAALLISASIYSLGLPRRNTLAAVFAVLVFSVLFDTQLTPILAAVFIATSLAAAFPLVIRSARILRYASNSMLITGALVAVPFFADLVSRFGFTDWIFYQLPPIEFGASDWQTEDGRMVRVHRVILGGALLEVVGVAYGVAIVLATLGGFALGAARIHRTEWSRELYVACAAIVILFVLGLYLGASFGNLVLYAVLYQGALYVALFGIFLQIGAGVRRRIDEEPHSLPFKAAAMAAVA